VPAGGGRRRAGAGGGDVDADEAVAELTVGRPTRGTLGKRRTIGCDKEEGNRREEGKKAASTERADEPEPREYKSSANADGAARGVFG